MYIIIKDIITVFMLMSITETLTYSIKRNSRRFSNSDQLMAETVMAKQQLNLNDNNSESNSPPSVHVNYKYSYEIRDPITGDDKQHEEKREGDLVQGQYSLIEPDGSRRIVAYISNGSEGFQAFVIKINASELTLPIDDNYTNTEIPLELKDKKMSLQAQIDEHEKQFNPLETQMTSESTTYIDMRNLKENADIDYWNDEEEKTNLKYMETSPSILYSLKSSMDKENGKSTKLSKNSLFRTKQNKTPANSNLNYIENLNSSPIIVMQNPLISSHNQTHDNLNFLNNGTRFQGRNESKKSKRSRRIRVTCTKQYGKVDNTSVKHKFNINIKRGSLQIL